MMDKNITFIIPNRGGKNIDFVLGKMHKFYPESAYIIITQDDNKPFMRGQLWNVAAHFVKTEYMCFLDNDMFFTKCIDLVKIYGEKKCMVIQPFDKISQVDINAGDLSFTVTSTNCDRVNRGSDGGSTFISMENFRKVNGMSNLYIGWGNEDNEFVKNRTGKVNIDHAIAHITHPRRNEDIHRHINSKLY